MTLFGCTSEQAFVGSDVIAVKQILTKNFKGLRVAFSCGLTLPVSHVCRTCIQARQRLHTGWMIPTGGP